MQTRAPSDESELEGRLSEPTSVVCHALAEYDGDIIVLGAGGKMGPSLCRMARRASMNPRRIIAVSRFSDPLRRRQLEDWQIEVIQGDLLDRQFVTSLPDCPLVVYMATLKFGSSSEPSRAWATNTIVPTFVCERFASSRIIAFSSGNVYPLVPIAKSRGSIETDSLAPIGEYAMSCVGRERVFEYFSRAHQIPVSIIRLNYATELRYGVLVDIAQRVWQRQTVSLEMGYMNVIWQADANAHALASLPLASSPPFVLNVTGPEILSVRQVACRFGELFGLPVTFSGHESHDALLNDASKSHERFGMPNVSARELVEWITDWVRAGRPIWQKSTHFEVRNGRF